MPLRVYYQYPGICKTHIRCWVHVAVLFNEAVFVRKRCMFVVMLCVANILWQWCTISPILEYACYHIDVVLIFPTLLSTLMHLVPSESSLYTRVAFHRTLALVAGVVTYPIRKQYHSGNLLLMCIMAYNFVVLTKELAPRPQTPALLKRATTAACSAFIIYAVHVVASIATIPLLGHRITSSRFESPVLDFVCLYDVWHFIMFYSYYFHVLPMKDENLRTETRTRNMLTTTLQQQQQQKHTHNNGYV